ncbi:hypothetical protein [Hyphococcus luteus]|jgi:hypothetical protein|uniref:hypothetical protein n=1 Tax=Hyphococcus luteus TaxID=2058213 RepID=UPI0013FD533F|nr:hypothetical protein [Marinicaulis flavus]
MSRLIQTASAGLFAAVAAACLYSLAVAAPGDGVKEERADGVRQSCEKAFCLVAFF